MATIQILGKPLKIDLMDAEQAGKYEKAVNAYLDYQESTDIQDEMLTKGLKCTIEDYCHRVFECLNAIFGDGTDREVFGDKCNMTDCMEAITQLINLTESNFQTEFESRFKKYLPNRQTQQAAQ